MLWRKKRRRPMATAHRKFQERARAVRNRPWRLLVALGVMVLATVGVIFLFWFSQAFVVQDVRVEAAEGYEVPGDLAEEALAMAAVPTQIPLARVDTAAAKERVLTDLRVADVQVRRSWPDEIVVVLTPRTPVLVVTQGGSPATLADAGGLLYDEVDPVPADLPQLRVPGGEVDAGLVAGVAAVHAGLPEELREEVTRMTLTRAGTMRFPLGRATIIWGPTTANEDKVVVLQALAEQPEMDLWDADGPPLSIDLSVPTLPVITGLPEETD